jgi:threonine-phosphate decarboxylase
LSDLHGGDIWAAARASGLAPEAIIDFSASINPLGLSHVAAAAVKKGVSLLSAYPEPHGAELTKELARYHDIPPENILTANGSNELIYLIAQSLRRARKDGDAQKVLIIEPAFSEYRRAFEGVGCRVDGFRLAASADFNFDLESFLEAARDYDVCIVTNPTSHIGGLIAKQDMLGIIDGCRQSRTLLIIDEAFCDFIKDGSVKVSAIDGEGVVVLRSMTKFFAMAGLRLGYAVASKNIIARLAVLRPTWSVNLLATQAAIASLGDDDYIEKTLNWFYIERPRMEALLRDISGLKVFAGAANFFLCEITSPAIGADMDAKFLRAAFIKRGVLIRDMTGVEGLGKAYFRVALRSRDDNELLAGLLREVFTKGDSNISTDK